jgi:hypothetical protein
MPRTEPICPARSQSVQLSIEVLGKPRCPCLTMAMLMPRFATASWQGKEALLGVGRRGEVEGCDGGHRDLFGRLPHLLSEIGAKPPLQRHGNGPSNRIGANRTVRPAGVWLSKRSCAKGEFVRLRRNL